MTECAQEHCENDAEYNASTATGDQDVCESCAHQLFDWGWTVREKEAGEP